MADDNYILITARLDEVRSTAEIQKQLDKISNNIILRIHNVELTQNFINNLNSAIKDVEKNIRININDVSIDQSKTIQQAQNISKQISSAMNQGVGSSNAGSNINRAFDISDKVANQLKKRYTDVAVLAETLQDKFKKVGTVTTEVLSHENQIIDQFRVTVTNADGAVEKLVYSLKQVDGTKKPAHAWEVVSATSSDNNIKLQEQLEKQTIKASDASLRLSNNLESVKQKFAEIVQVHDGDANIANYLDNAVKAINALNGADSSNFNKLKINAENAIRTYTDYLNKLKTADAQAEQSQRRLDAQLVSSQKTLDHNIMILGNLSKNSIFGKNATSPEVVEMQANVDKLRESYQNLKTNTTDSIASPELVGKFKELNVQIVDTIVNSQKLAKTLGDKTTNVIPEVELNNLKTLMNNLKASDVEVDKLKADYGELVGLMIQAQDTGDWSNYLKQLSIFKSKFTEAKSEVKATTAATSELERMAKSLSSNKMNTFFDKNSNNAQVNALKTEINSLINEWTTLNSEIQTTGKVSPAMATRLEELKAKMQTATTAADTLQRNIKEVANAQKLATQKQSLDTRITSWLQNNTRASQDTIAKLKEMQAQVRDADAQTMFNLNNQFRQITANTRAAGEVVHEEEVNYLKALYNNLKASDVALDEFKADYQELNALLSQAQTTGDYTQYFTQLDIFKSKFTEAKTEIKATTAATSDLEKMSKSLASDKMNTFFDKNAGNVQVNALKTEISGLINEWATLKTEIDNTGRVTHTMQTRLDDLKTRMQNATSAADMLQANIKHIADTQKLATQQQSLDTRISSWLQNNTRASAETIASLKNLQAQIHDADAQTMFNLNNQFRQITANARAAGEAGLKLSDIIKQKLGKFAGWFSIATVVMRGVNKLKEMYRTVVELDSAMVGLRKVTDETDAVYNKFFTDAAKNAKILGTSIKDIIDSTTEFARLGYSLADSQLLAQMATLYKNVGDGIDIGQATSNLISTMKAFGLSANEVESIIDKFNKVGGICCP